MKTIITTIFAAFSISAVIAQVPNQVQDSTKVENLGEVLIKSVRVAADSPITHSNLSAEQLEKRNLGQDIPFMLQYLPSVVSTSDAGAGIGYTSFRVRGSDASRINVTLNGIPFNDAESQGTFFVNLPDFTSSVESLQLQRGVGTSVNGSGSFGASLNLLTDGISKEASAEIASSIGSFNTRRHNLKFSTGLLNDHIEIAGRLSSIKSDGYVDRASSDLQSYFLQASYVDDNTLIKAIGFGGREETYQAYWGIDASQLAENRRFNIIGQQFDANGDFEGFYDNEVDNYAQDHYQLLWNQKYDNKWSSNVAMNYTYGRGYFEQYVDDQFYPNNFFSDQASFEFLGVEPYTINGAEITSTDYIRRRWLDNDFYAINASVNYKDENWDTTTGAFASLYQGDHFGEILWSEFPIDYDYKERYYEGTGEKTEVTVFSKATYKIATQWSVYGDLQGRFVRHTTTGIESDKTPLEVAVNYNFFNPKFGAAYQHNDANQLYLSYGRANREPRRSDFEEGLFIAERLDDYELGWRYKKEKVMVNTNAYFMNYKDQLVLTGALNDVGAPIRATSGNSYRLGLEIDAAISLTKHVKLMPNLAVSTNKNVDFIFQQDGEVVNLGNTNLPFSPAIVAANNLMIRPLKNFEIGLLSKYVGEQYMGNIDSEFSKLDAYFIQDINLVYRLQGVPFVKEIVFNGLVNNVLDTQFVNNGFFFTFDDDFSVPGEVTTQEGAGFYPQAGANFLVGATIKF
ncbi:TonB-dependent receptor [Patiriisocius sp. Uisw_017]|jgi:iron complex outermembrane receptor protein|uniref:TonB-dependent receptor n=1 Tax=Patiriisocius sp. Uisw_017 TaxID=3230968 RepID=UPI0039E77AEC